MKEITLEDLLEAGCHFGHKADRWHPKAHGFIYTEKNGVHIIDLAQTKAGLEAACSYIRTLISQGGEVLFVGTKRQAKGVVEKEASEAEAPYLVHRWIGGFLTNWESIKKNIDTINRLQEDKDTGKWKQFPKHEQVKLDRYLTRLKTQYGGVLKLAGVPDAVFIIDIKKESTAVSETIKKNIVSIGVVDTNANPETITYPIPSNDDAVGAISYITRAVAQAYREGKDVYSKKEKDIKGETGKKPAEKPVSSDKKDGVSAPKSQKPREQSIREDTNTPARSPKEKAVEKSADAKPKNKKTTPNTKPEKKTKASSKK